MGRENSLGKCPGRRRSQPAFALGILLALACLGGIPQVAAAPGRHAKTPAAPAGADADWLRRARAPGVVIAVGFDDIREWARYNWDRDHCDAAYQVPVDGRLAGCRHNAWDKEIRASGKGSLRFDILPGSGEDGGGNVVIPFGDYDASQFGANSEFWVAWRQRMDERYYQGYRARGGRSTYFKQVIIAQGDMPRPGGRQPAVANACSEAELVIVSSDPDNGPAFPVGYIECRRYLGFERVLGKGDYLGDARGSKVISRQNMRLGPGGESTCIFHPPKRLDQSGCFTYQPDRWITYMVHLKLGPEGRAVSSVSGREQPGYIDSTYELYAAPSGDDFQLLHRQTGVVIPRGQHYLGGDPLLKSSYESGWSPNNAHPQARYGKLWLLSYMTAKDDSEATPKASTWYDEVIVSRCRIAAPGYPIPKQCNPPAAVPADPPGSGRATLAAEPLPAGR